MTQKSPESTALMPGSFNPFTVGHMDILRRSLAMFDRVVVSVGVNRSKTTEAEIDTRLEAIRRAVAGMDGVEVMAWDGLTVDAARSVGAVAMVRGVRSVADFDYERGLAELNRRIAGIDTILLVAAPELAVVSSSAVRELESFGYDVKEFLP